MTQEEMKIELEELAVRFSEGWHEGIKIDASDIMLLNKAAQALAQEQEPKDWKTPLKEDAPLVKWAKEQTPPQRTWVGLTDDEISTLWDEWKDAVCLDHKTWAKAIEAILKEKNT